MNNIETILAVIIGVLLLLALGRALYLVGRSLWWSEEPLTSGDDGL